jgi:hypothetical protein
LGSVAGNGFTWWGEIIIAYYHRIPDISGHSVQIHVENNSNVDCQHYLRNVVECDVKCQLAPSQLLDKLLVAVQKKMQGVTGMWHFSVCGASRTIAQSRNPNAGAPRTRHDNRPMSEDSNLRPTTIIYSNPGSSMKPPLSRLPVLKLTVADRYLHVSSFQKNRCSTAYLRMWLQKGTYHNKQALWLHLAGVARTKDIPKLTRRPFDLLKQTPADQSRLPHCRACRVVE